MARRPVMPCSAGQAILLPPSWAHWATNLVPSYLSQNDFSKLLSAPGCSPVFHSIAPNVKSRRQSMFSLLGKPIPATLFSSLRRIGRTRLRHWIPTAGPMATRASSSFTRRETVPFSCKSSIIIQTSSATSRPQNLVSRDPDLKTSLEDASPASAGFFFPCLKLNQERMSCSNARFWAS